MSDAQQITTNLPGLVIRLLVADGERVREGQGILVTETMKCEQTLLAPSTAPSPSPTRSATSSSPATSSPR